MKNKIYLYDTTLRDGAQTQGISFSLNDKLKITELLDELGIHYIEGGWPGANPKDTEYFEIMKKRNLKNSKLVAFGSTRKAHNKAEEDQNLKAIIEAGTNQADIFCKGWDFHVNEVLKIDLNQNLDMVYDSVVYLKKYIPDVVLGIEHFFDGYKANPDYVKRIIKTAQDAGAYWVGMADTNGGCFPDEIVKIVDEVKSQFDILYSVHAHNDIGFALINTIAAAEHGVSVLHGTINGIGERCGMTDLCALIPNLKLKMGIDCVSDDQLKKLKEIAFVVAGCGGFKVQKYSPYIGENAFYHKAGIHVDAVLKNPSSYNHIKPELVGNNSTTSISEMSGKANILFIASKMGINLEKDDPRMLKLLDFIKIQENNGVQFDGANVTQYVLFKKYLQDYKYHIKIKKFDFNMEKTYINDIEDKNIPLINASIHLMINDKEEQITIEDNKDPIRALTRCLMECIKRHFSNIADCLKVVDVKVRVLDYTYNEHNIHKFRVFLEVEDTASGQTLTAVAALHDIYSSFLSAFVDVIEFKLMQNNQ